MIEVKQTICDKGNGDCFRACVASLLELDITQVPHFILFNSPLWMDVFISFTNTLGCEYYGVMNYSKKNDNDIDVEYTINGYTLASVPSLNYEGTTHSVIINKNGLVVHDPSLGLSYNGQNIIENGAIIYWYLLRSIPPTQEIDAK